MTIGEALKNHRLTQQMSQEEVATKILVTRTSISNWETGKTVPDSLNLLKLSTLYGCSVDELLKKERAGMKKNFRTMTYGAGLKDGTMRLKIETDASKFFPKGVEVKASVDLETGEVTFFVEQEELKKLKAATDEK
ncbi:MAG: helix-turn-helix transcriptional regulator [Enterococcus casseliflavus]|uniref:helix-turn-helix domain-containing protein n=1 Tax=Enterococcus casseliflavus TaxID=37734 RepID=UPI000EB18202|nr:helix-turn-helix transcriptional regulator [Enterococcus casseliflavus]AYJ46512.1 XRE family transcriptional regulator [Enterococcus casseliflavus]MBS5813796.1 helix-turn-helix transcriptional regulator [Enterococcus casseliflavus]MCD4962086.1 helix-turn-helix transcriptional regulator [Enterococcus casseliflavus]MDU3375281.1 helix-turn-helix transcriptional regulator [Enterococcus casseliflavus]